MAKYKLAYKDKDNKLQEVMYNDVKRAVTGLFIIAENNLKGWIKTYKNNAWIIIAKT